jgi:hypothetical protein
MMFPKRQTKRERLAAIMREIGMDDPPELPEECDVGDTSNAGTGNTCEPITIVQDGQVLHGTDWITPEDYIDDDVASGRLVSLKGTTPPELPGLDTEDTGEGGAYP